MRLEYHTGSTFKTFALAMVTVIGLLLLGAYIGLWVTPVLLALAHDGWSGLSQIRIANATPQLPEWVGPPYTLTRVLAGMAYFIPAIAGMVYVGQLGERLYRYLVVKLRWLTDEEVLEARKREKQYL